MTGAANWPKYAVVNLARATTIATGAGFCRRHATTGSMRATHLLSGCANGATSALRLATGGVLLLAAFGVGAPVSAAETTTLTASYTISIAGVTVGRADVRSRFTDNGYAAAINGSTYGISRMVSDARAVLAGSGKISGARVAPVSYNLETSESGFETHVSMSMRGGSVVGLDAVPSLIEAADRVPLTARHKNNILDPVGAFVVALDRPGEPDGRRVCNRTVKVFDGWQRFDIRLAYRETKAVNGSYSGDVIVCSARYVPIAGHRPSRESVEYMANNKRLEIWMVPIDGTRLLVPYRILIGTKIGDLVIGARQFETTRTEQQASTN